jgi:glutamine synthetase
MATPQAEKLFDKYQVLSPKELHSRYEIYLEGYVKHVNIEAQASVQMVKRLFIPAGIKFAAELAGAIGALKSASAPATVQKELLATVSGLLSVISEKVAVLESAIEKAHHVADVAKRAEAFRDKVVVAMSALRKDVDSLEGVTPAELWPVPTYAEMLFKL